jgi:hypothetical protein
MDSWTVATIVDLSIVAAASSLLLADGLTGRTQERTAPPPSPSWLGAFRHALSRSPLSQRSHTAHEGATTARLIGAAGLVFVTLCALGSVVILAHH